MFTHPAGSVEFFIDLALTAMLFLNAAATRTVERVR